MKESVIIVAGGSGKRFGSSTPKQFLNLNGKPVLMHTLEVFFRYNNTIEIILVLPKEHISTWNYLVDKHNFPINHTLVEGGKERFNSVKNGLEHASGKLIAVHDGVRPLANRKTIEKSFKAAQEFGAAIPVTPIVETLRKLSANNSITVNREEYRAVQTPQCFTQEVLLKAYQQEYQENFTDDASVVENLGQKVALFEGNKENIKITNPSDLAIAEVLLQL